jgi:hypothetical protein
MRIANYFQYFQGKFCHFYDVFSKPNLEQPEIHFF